MIEPTDIDVLEALAKAAIINDDPNDWPLEGAVGWDRAEDNRFVATLSPSAVLALIAELRQERERSDPAKDERLARYMAMATPLGYQSALTVVQEMTKLIDAETRARGHGL